MQLLRPRPRQVESDGGAALRKKARTPEHLSVARMGRGQRSSGRFLLASGCANLISSRRLRSSGGVERRNLRTSGRSKRIVPNSGLSPRNVLDSGGNKS